MSEARQLEVDIWQSVGSVFAQIVREIAIHLGKTPLLKKE